MGDEVEIGHIWGKLGRPTKIELQSTPGKTITKEQIRKQVWDFLEENDLVNFPRPPHKRIPNFIGAAHAGQKVVSLEEFQSKDAFSVNPDKPQEEVRYQVLDHKKILLVPTPRLKTGLFNYIDHPGGNTSKEFLRTLASRQGIDNHSRPLSYNSKINVDIVVIGAVAVDRLGHRIGKGEGFADLEFAMGVQLGSISSETIVISTVHDCQVFDSMPEEIFGEHDVPVDIIVTPTKIYRVKNRLPKPKGIYWEKLSVDKINKIPILRKLKEAEESGSNEVPKEPQRSRNSSNNSTHSGHDSQAKKEDNGEKTNRSRVKRDNGNENTIEGQDQRKPQRNQNRNRRRENHNGSDMGKPKSEGLNGVISDEAQINGDLESRREKDDIFNEKGNENEVENEGKPSRNRNRNRRKRHDSVDGSDVEKAKSEDSEKRNGSLSSKGQTNENLLNRGVKEDYVNEEGAKKVTENGHQNGNKKTRDTKKDGRPNGVTSIINSEEEVYDERPMLYVGKIPKSARVTDLKDVLHERGVKAKQLVWKGGRGFAFLYFGDTEDAEELYTKLHDLQIGGVNLDVQREKNKE